MNGRSPATRLSFLEARSRAQVAISALSEAEILFDLRKRPEATKLAIAFDDFRASIPVLPWDFATAESYGSLAFHLKATNKTLDTMDLLIAAQAMATGASLVSRGKAFQDALPLLATVNWATDLQPVR